MKPQPRSLLFVPGNDEHKLAKALASGADALLIDLEDSVAPEAKVEARRIAARFLSAQAGEGGRPRLYVRVNDLGGGLTREDLAAVLPAGAEGVMLPKANSGADIATLAAMAAEIAGSPEPVGIIAIATETPLAVLQLHSFIGAHPWLEGLSWGAEDLGAALGSQTARDASGAFTGPFALARNLCLMAAHAAGVQAIDGIYADFKDEAGLQAEAAEAARDGFTGKMAIHPAQVPIINMTFEPGAEAIAEAEAILAAFAASPGTGAVGFRGRMIDRPHLLRAQRLLATARARRRP